MFPGKLEEFDGHISENLAMERCQVSQQSLLHAAAQEGLHVLCQELLSAAKLRGRRKASSKLQKFNFVSRRIPGSSLFFVEFFSLTPEFGAATVPDFF